MRFDKIMPSVHKNDTDKSRKIPWRMHISQRWNTRSYVLCFFNDFTCRTYSYSCSAF